MEESIALHDVMYVFGLKNNLILISTLEDKGMRVSFLKGKVLTWLVGSLMKNAFTLGTIYEGLYRVTGRPLLALDHNTNYLRE